MGSVGFNAKVCPASPALSRAEYNVMVTNEPVALRRDDAKKVDDYWRIASQKFPDLSRELAILNLDRYELGTGGEITEYSRLTDYAMFVAHGNQDLVPRSAGLSMEAMRKINPQAASSFTLTSDWYVVFGIRPANVLAPNQVTNIPEGMLRASTPNPFDFVVERLGKELGVQKESVDEVVFTGIGYGLDYPCVVSSFVILLNLSRAEIEKVHKERTALGGPSDLIFKGSTLGAMKEFLRETHPGSPNIAALNFIKHCHGRKELMNTADGLGIRRNIMGTMEEFCADSGIGITRARASHQKK